MKNIIITYGVKAAVVFITMFTLVACGSSDSDPDSDPDPEPTGEALWDHLQQENYRTTWALWPGTEELQEGSEPHGMLQTIYLNNIAFDAVTDGEIPLPDGAIVVKENYMPDGTFAAATSMYKVDGYNPDFNDWFWLQNEPNGNILAEGILDMCQACHAQASDHDNLFLYTEFPPEGISQSFLHNGERTGTFMAGLAGNNSKTIPTSLIRSAISSDEKHQIEQWVSGNPDLQN